MFENLGSTRRTLLMGVAGLAAAGIIGFGGIASAATAVPQQSPAVVHAAAQAPKRVAVHGTLKTVNKDSVVVTTKDGKDETIAVNDSTRIAVGMNHKAALSDLKTGEAVTVLLAGQDTQNPTASAIDQRQGIPLEQLRQAIMEHTVRGKITNIQNTTLTLENKHDTFTVTTTAETIFLLPGNQHAAITDLKVGDEVTAIGSREQSTPNTGTSNAKTLTARVVTTATPKQIENALRKHAASGTITAINGNTLTISRTDKQGKPHTTTVQLTDQTTYFKGKHEQAAKSDLQVGTKIIVLGQRDAATGTVTARVVHIGK